MKKLSLMIGVLLSMSLTLSAEKEDVPMTIASKGHSTKLTTVKRAPIYIPIEVLYDDATHAIEVRTEEDIDAQVYLLTEEGDVLGYSDCLNTTFTVPADFTGFLTISIESSEWTAVGEIEI